MKIKNLLILILILGALLRLLWLGSIPSGFFRDEAAISYNAYSIWKTGADEFGVKLPLVFRSFEVFFLPAYIYLSAPIVGVLGLSEFSSRFLSSLSGIVAVYLVFLISKEIWNEKVGVIAAFLLVIAPWHIFYSRGTFEGNLALTLFTAGFYFWIRYLNKDKIKYFLFSGILFALSMYSYQAERAVVPLFAISATIIGFKKLWQNKLKLIVPVIVFVLIMIPLLSLSFKAGGYHRALGVSIFSQEANPPGWVTGIESGVFINNSIYLRTKEVASLYLSYFSPKNLFTLGDYNKQRSVENFSVFYTFMFVGLLYGILNIFTELNTKTKLLLVWIFAGPIPAALTGDPFHTYRSLLMYLPMTILIGLGFYRILEINFKSKLIHKVIFLGICLISLSGFVFSYVFVNKAARAHDWDYGYKEIVDFVNRQPMDTKIVIDDPWTESYINYLFFAKIDPNVYQNAVSALGNPSNYYYSDSSKIRPKKLGNIEFRKVDWPTERGNTGMTFIMWATELPDSEFKTDPKVTLLKQIYYPDKTVAFKIVKIN